MAEMKIIEGSLTARDSRIAIVASRFNDLIVEGLIRGALGTLVQHGINEADIQLVRVPGAVELPLAVNRLATSRRFDAIIALGAVIRGATPHFDFIAAECSRGLQQVSLEQGVPVAFGVLTVDTVEQAIERAGTKAGNKGSEAALSALEMSDLLRKLE